MARLGDLLKPLDIGLFERPPDGKTVNLPATLGHAAARLHRILLGVFVEISFVVVPLRHFPPGKIAAHFQIERDGDLRGTFGEFLGGRIRTGRDTSPQRQPAARCRRLAEKTPS